MGGKAREIIQSFIYIILMEKNIQMMKALIFVVISICLR